MFFLQLHFFYAGSLIHYVASPAEENYIDITVLSFPFCGAITSGGWSLQGQLSLESEYLVLFYLYILLYCDFFLLIYIGTLCSPIGSCSFTISAHSLVQYNLFLNVSSNVHLAYFCKQRSRFLNFAIYLPRRALRLQIKKYLRVPHFQLM